MDGLPSFYLAPERWKSPWRLEGAEAHHLSRVLRASEGDRIRLFDGAGREGEFEIEKLAKKRADLAVIQLREVSRPPGLTLAVGWSRQARRGWLLEKAVELGAARIVFFAGDHSQGAPPPTPKDTWREKLVQAAKQCANPWLPELEVADGIAGVASLGETFDRRLVLCETGDAKLVEPADFVPPALAVIGPEGGLSQAEIDRLADVGFAPRSLGPRVLRFETAAVLCLGLSFWTLASEK